MKNKELLKCTEFGTVKKVRVRFHPRAREEISVLPEKIKKELGFLIYLLEIGESLSMPHSKPMSGVMPGVSELRVKGRDGAYRVFYFLKSELGILVFHVFKKTTEKTPKLEIDLGRKRLHDMLRSKE